MKRTLGIGFCAVLWTSAMAVAAPQLAGKQEQDWFPDVPATHWARPTLLLFARPGIITGDSQGHFNGGAAVTRREFALILDRWNARSSSPRPIPRWANSQKTSLTRYEFAVALSRLEPLFRTQTPSTLPVQTAASQSEGPATDFPDVAPTHWAFGGVRHVELLGIMEGDYLGQFHGDALLTRYELVVALMRAQPSHGLTGPSNERG